MSSGEKPRGDRKMRSLVVMMLFVSLLALVAGRASTVNAQDQTEQDATFRVVNASPGAPDLDVIVDGAAVAKGVAFGKASEYASVSAGDHQVQFVPAGEGADAALIDKKISFDKGEAHILAVVNDLKDIDVEDYNVDLDAVDEGQARIRGINVTPDTEGFAVAITGGDTLFDGLDFNDASDYKNQDPGTYDFEIKEGDNDTPIATASGVQFDQGNVYDLFIIGSSGGSDVSILSLVTNVSPTCAALLGVGSAEDACVRVLNADAGSNQVNFLVNDSAIATDVSFGTASDFVAVPAGDDRKIAAAPSSGQQDQMLADATQSLQAGQAYEIVLAGRIDDEDLLVNQIDLTPLPEGQARVRLINASQDADEGDLVIADGDQLFGGVSYQDVTDYKVIDADTYDLQFKKSGSDEVIVAANSLALKEGMAYDLVLIGNQSDNSLKLVLLEANATLRQGGAATPVAGTPGAEAPVVTPEVVGTPVNQD